MSNDNPGDRFGFSEASMREVCGEHLEAGILRTGCYVPTRHEVATMDPEKLIPILNDWFWESPTELIPSDAQERAVIAILEARPDAKAFHVFIEEMKRFKKPAAPAADGSTKPLVT